MEHSKGLHPLTHWWVNALPHRWYVRRHIPKFLKSCPDPFRGQVLEVGAGSGWTSRTILQTFPQVELTATDIDSQATEQFQQLQSSHGRRLKIKEANILQLPFDREAFDIVIAINVMQQLKPYGVRKALQEMLRVVRPGGLVGISDYLLIANPLRPTHEIVRQAIEQETCEIEYEKGGRKYDLWIRKQYSVDRERLK